MLINCIHVFGIYSNSFFIFSFFILFYFFVFFSLLGLRDALLRSFC